MLRKYLTSVSEEIENLKNAVQKTEWDVARAKAHALKPKLNYLGLTDLFQKMREIEQDILYQNETERLIEKIEYVENIWNKARSEIDIYVF